MIVVTGATGHLGRWVIEGLLRKIPAQEIVAAVRNPEKAADFAARGVVVRQMDYDQPKTIEAAFAGAEKVLLISGNELGKRIAQHTAAIAAAKRAGVKLLAYTSILHADTSSLKLAEEHRATEALIRASEIPFIFLRNGWYLENYTEHLAQALAHGAIFGSAREGKIAAASRADYADAAVAVLLTKGLQNKVYELGGAPFTMTDFASEVSKVSGKAVAYKDLPEAQYREALAGAGIPAPMAEVLANADAGVARGELDDASGDLEKLLGHPATRFLAAVKSALAKTT